jgi:PPOX class probable F420-dependent enzyme
MTQEEIDAFLLGRRVMNVATNGPTGHPHVVAMWYGFLDGRPALWTFARSQKVANLRRDPKLTALVEAGNTYETLQGVELVGRGRIIDDPAVTLAVGLSVVDRYGGPLTAETRARTEARSAKRVVVAIDVERTVSWDHTKLGGVD